MPVLQYAATVEMQHVTWHHQILCCGVQLGGWWICLLAYEDMWSATRGKRTVITAGWQDIVSSNVWLYNKLNHVFSFAKVVPLKWGKFSFDFCHDAWGVLGYKLMKTSAPQRWSMCWKWLCMHAFCCQHYTIPALKHMYVISNKASYIALNLVTHQTCARHG